MILWQKTGEEQGLCHWMDICGFQIPFCYWVALCSRTRSLRSFEFSHRHRTEGLCVLRRHLARVSSCLRNEAGGPGLSWNDTFILARQQGEWVSLDHGLLGASIGGSQMEIWPGPQEAQAQGLLIVSYPHRADTVVFGGSL